MTGSNAEYIARAGRYRLLDALGKRQNFTQVLNETLADPAARDIVNHTAASAFGGYVRLADGDLRQAMNIIERERQAAEDLRDI